MSDIKLNFKTEDLEKDLENLNPRIEQELNNSIFNLAQATYSGLIAKIQGMGINPKNRQTYLNALKVEQLNNNEWIISLEGSEANKLESGFSGYSIKDQLLKSTSSVSSGSRSGQPWVQTTKEGKKYAAVPFGHQPFSKQGASGNLGEDIKSLLAKNRKGEEQPLTKIFKDLEGSPISGKVASVNNISGKPNLASITKYQNVEDSGKVSSIYLTFRTVHEDSSGWQHPGFEGYQIFQEAQIYLDQEIDNIFKTLI